MRGGLPYVLLGPPCGATNAVTMPGEQCIIVFQLKPMLKISCAIHTVCRVTIRLIIETLFDVFSEVASLDWIL